jgi:hypothetical protein
VRFFLAGVMARRVTGGQLAGRAVAAGKTAVVSEEATGLWHDRRRRLDFGNHTCFFCRPFRGKPTAAQWLALLDHLADLAGREGTDLVVIDPLASFLPGRDENHAGLMMEALAPLPRLTERGLAVWLLHHPGKDEPAEGPSGRGSGARQAFADVLLRMQGFGSPSGDDRRRILRGWSRFEETPRELVIELNREGADYAARGDVREGEFQDRWGQLRSVLAAAPGKLTRREIEAGWPDGPGPSEATLRRWLEKAVERGLILWEGAGSKEAPFRYWLPGSEERWTTDDEHLIHQLYEATGGPGRRPPRRAANRRRPEGLAGPAGRAGSGKWPRRKAGRDTDPPCTAQAQEFICMSGAGGYDRTGTRRLSLRQRGGAPARDLAGPAEGDAVSQTPPHSASPGPAPPARPPKLLDRVRAALRVRHYSLRTEEA